MIDNKRETIQQEAINALLMNTTKEGFVRGTCEIITGLGKTFIALHLIRHLKEKKILFLAETTVNWRH